MPIIKNLADAYNRRQACRWDTSAREKARTAPPEPWQCERCQAINNPDLANCRGCGNHITAIGYWSPIH